MRQLFGLIITLSLLTSCSESFNSPDTKAFNDKISSRTDIKTPEELIRIYYDYPANESTPKLTISTKDVSDNNVEITLIHEGLEDDSQSGVKIVMTAKQTKETWTVLQIRENWKCWDGRGHTSWGTTPCN
jgi:hypothetical protein